MSMMIRRKEHLANYVEHQGWVCFATPAFKRQRTDEPEAASGRLVSMDLDTGKTKGQGKGPQNGCFNCGGEHYAKDCPKPFNPDWMSLPNNASQKGTKGKGKGESKGKGKGDKGKGKGKGDKGKGKGGKPWFPNQAQWKTYNPGNFFQNAQWQRWGPQSYGKGKGK